jgi:hypothetical protein
MTVFDIGYFLSTGSLRMSDASFNSRLSDFAEQVSISPQYVQNARLFYEEKLLFQTV